MIETLFAFIGGLLMGFGLGLVLAMPSNPPIRHGYQPTESLDASKPPRGGSGLVKPGKERGTVLHSGPKTDPDKPEEPEVPENGIRKQYEDE